MCVTPYSFCVLLYHYFPRVPKRFASEPTSIVLFARIVQYALTMNARHRKIEKVLKALANARRLAIIHFLQSKKKATVGEIAEELKISFKATSKHLSLLVAAEILSKEQKSNYMFFEINADLPDAARKITALL